MEVGVFDQETFNFGQICLRYSKSKLGRSGSVTPCSACKHYLFIFCIRGLSTLRILPLRRNAARNPCCGNSCLYLNINWYKMLAWVCGGLVLLSALTFVGRRMWSRNLYIRTARPRTALSGGRFSAVRPRCRNGGSRSASRPRSTGSFPDADLQLGGAAAHVLSVQFSLIFLNFKTTIFQPCYVPFHDKTLNHNRIF